MDPQSESMAEIKTIEDELLEFTNIISKFEDHNQTDHNVFYRKLIELELQNRLLKRKLEELENYVQNKL